MGASRLYLNVLDHDPVERGRLEKPEGMMRASVKPGGERCPEGAIPACPGKRFPRRWPFSMAGGG